MNHCDPISELVATHCTHPDTIKETITSCTTTITTHNPDINAVIWHDEAFVDKQVTRLIDHRESAQDLPLYGVPILVKEVESSIAGTPGSWGNKAMKDARVRDSFTSISTQRLIDAGAIIVGKTNNPELALTVTTESRAHGPCSNPLDLTRNSGGSSGGSGAAVAAGMVGVATASDGGGSARIPASHCGVIGYKCSRGFIPLGPAVDEAWNGLVTKGLISSRVSDLQTVASVMSGTSFPDKKNTSHLRIGVRTQGFASLYDIDPAVREAALLFTDFLSNRRHDVVESSPLSYDDVSFIPSFLTIIGCNTRDEINFLKNHVEPHVNIDECDESTQFFYHEGQKTSDEQWASAVDRIAPFTYAIDEWFKTHDVLITPTCAKIAPLHGEVQRDLELEPLKYGALCFPSNVSGCPSISLPVRTQHESGLPVGIQLIAARGHDDLLFGLAEEIYDEYPDIFTTERRNITS